MTDCFVREVGHWSDDHVVFLVSSRMGRARLRDLQVKPEERGKGYASRFLARLTKLADAMGVTLELTASPYGEEQLRLNHDDLQAFYRRHGFVFESGYDPALGYMIRIPSPNPRVAA